jgi:hypothetical protein
MPWGKRVILGVVGAVGIVLATGCAEVTPDPLPNPLPIFADDEGIEIADNGPLPPIEFGESGLSVKASGVDHQSAEFVVYTGNGTTEQATLHTGETSTVRGVTITLCATWVNNQSQAGSDTDVGSNEYSDRAYFVFSLDGSTPVCPERLD